MFCLRHDFMFNFVKYCDIYIEVLKYNSIIRYQITFSLRLEKGIQ